MSVNRADLLVEALPYIRNYSGSTLVIKYGGHAMADEALKNGFAQDISLLRHVGVNPVVVHGGGPQIDELLNRLKIDFHFVEGQRFTDESIMEVVEMVLCGRVGKDIVSRITRAGSMAVGLSGKDSGLIRAVRKRLPKTKDRSEGRGEEAPGAGPGAGLTSGPVPGPEVSAGVNSDGGLDIGLVGEPTAINVSLLNHLTRGGFIPIIAPIGVDDNGTAYNINADAVAGAVAVALAAKKLILLTDVEGVLNAGGELIERLSEGQINDLKKSGDISGGMIPKLDCALAALKGGCSGASIIDGRVPHALLLELFTDKGCGTEVYL
ncbi:MAG: acetylglutamate kinase [Deltaproteobacteria bacterium]|jgi:acetylglutamate kinase|nr:acetylglutamate kinase [Deltaproteobacteria bacterium]